MEGIGDVCQHGEVDDSTAIIVTDTAAIREYLVGSGAAIGTDHCGVHGGTC